MKMQMIFILPNTLTGPNLFSHRPANNITGCKVLRIGRITFHKPFAVGISQITAFAPGAFGYQTARPINTRWMKLHELHILKGQFGP